MALTYLAYTNVANPTWNADHSVIDCIVTFTGLGTFPFSASPDDPEPHGREIYERAIAGDFGTISEAP